MGVSLTAITGACDRSRIARGKSSHLLALPDQEGFDSLQI
jgi:hypothetical protein